jgi:hypothetical protein
MAGFRAGEEVLQGSARHGLYAGVAVAAVVGQIVEKKYSIGVFRTFLISVSAGVLFALLFDCIAVRIKRAMHEKESNHP